jgi:hypothetical protein
VTQAAWSFERAQMSDLSGSGGEPWFEASVKAAQTSILPSIHTAVVTACANSQAFDCTNTSCKVRKITESPHANSTARCGDLGSVQPLFQKDFSSPRTQIKIISAAVLSLRGALAIVTDAGQDAVDADVLQTSGTEADGEVVWS